MIARPPAKGGRINPTNDFECVRLRSAGDRQFRFLRNAFGSARESNRIVAPRQFQNVAIRAIHLRVKSKIRREPLRDRRVHALLRVMDQERGRGWLAMLVQNAQGHGLRGQCGKENIDIIAETEVLSSLADVERNARFPFSGVAAVKLNETIIESQTGEAAGQRLLIEN